MTVTISPMGTGMYRAMAKFGDGEVIVWAFGISHTDALNKVFSKMITIQAYDTGTNDNR